MYLTRMKTKHGYAVKMFFKDDADYGDFMKYMNRVINNFYLPEALRKSMQNLKTTIEYYKSEIEDTEYKITSIIFEDDCIEIFYVMIGLLFNFHTDKNDNDETGSNFNYRVG